MVPFCGVPCSILLTLPLYGGTSKDTLGTPSAAHPTGCLHYMPLRYILLFPVVLGASNGG